MFVYPRNDGGDKNGYSFIGNETGSENSRSEFIRKFACKKYGVGGDARDITVLLSNMHKFLTDFLTYLADEYPGQKVWDGNDRRFRLEMDLWQLYPHRDGDPVYLCDMCGCEFHWDLTGVCPTHRCGGHLHTTTFAEAKAKRRLLVKATRFSTRRHAAH